MLAHHEAVTGGDPFLGLLVLAVIFFGALAGALAWRRE